jgi:hypothetical protein
MWNEIETPLAVKVGALILTAAVLVWMGMWAVAEFSWL